MQTLPNFRTREYELKSMKTKQRIVRFKLFYGFSNRFGMSEIGLLLIIAMMISCIWVIMEISDKVMEMEFQGFDQWAIRILRDSDDLSRPLGPGWLLSTARFVTTLGGYTVLGVLTALAGGYFIINRLHGSALLIVVAFVGGTLVCNFLKLLFSRARPEIEHFVFTESCSFPSGHAMLSAVVYLTLWAMLVPAKANKQIKIFLLGVALLLTLLIGLTRIYLGVHYPSDVLAGWIVGTVWTVTCLLVGRYFQESVNGEKQAVKMKQ